MTFRQAGALALVVALAGCSSPPAPLPQGLTGDEVDAIRQEQIREWWESIAPDEPMPIVEVVEYLDSGESPPTTECVLDQNIPGVTRSGQDGFTLDGGIEGQRLLHRAFFVCAQMYQTAAVTGEELGIYSADQVEYLENYFESRLMPCLATNGYEVSSKPVGLPTDGNYLYWSPYELITPQPSTAAEWDWIDFRCPPPPFGAFYRPGMSAP